MRKGEKKEVENKHSMGFEEEKIERSFYINSNFHSIQCDCQIYPKHQQQQKMIMNIYISMFHIYICHYIMIGT